MTRTVSTGNAPIDHTATPLWRAGWPGEATARIRFPDGVAFYNNVDGRWVGMDMAGQFMSNDGLRFDEHPGLFDALFVAFHTMTLETVLDCIRARYGDTTRPAVEFRDAPEKKATR